LIADYTDFVSLITQILYDFLGSPLVRAGFFMGDDKWLSGLKPVVCISIVPQPEGWGYGKVVFSI